jgi:hypothetical protein
MTRGQIICITNEGVKTSIEFNGDMYLSWHGKNVVNELKKDMAYDDYVKLVEDFNRQNFEYDEQLFYDVDKEYLDMNKENYFSAWFSDYLYIKNISDEDQIVIDEEFNKITLHPQGYVVLYFGKYDESDEDEYEVLYNATIDKGGRLKKICEELGWCVHEEDEGYYLSKYSPAGEDFGFYISKDNPYEDVQEYSDDFDPDEHCIMWIKEMDTVSGVPQSVRELIRDAEAIAGMLSELATYLNNKK